MVNVQEPVISETLRLRGAVARARRALAPYSLSLLLAVLYLLCAQILAASRGEAVGASIIGYVQQLGMVAPIFILAWAIGQFCIMVVAEKPASPLRSFRDKLATLVLDGQRWDNAIPFLTVIMLVSTAFSYFKSAIPNLQPFAWDRTFDNLDVWLHGGIRPWEWLQPVLGWPQISFAVNFVYNLWFFVMIGVWLWLAFTRSEQAPRHQFLLAFLLTWIIGGSVLATVFSSAGPCYFANFVPGADPYNALMAYLHSVDASELPIWALDTQAMLWRGYVDPAGNLSGISAMPSMHVATATLFVPLGFRMSRQTGWAACIFWLFIMLGSVHLGWHYAADGYLGAALALSFWWLAGLMAGNRGAAHG